MRAYDNRIYRIWRAMQNRCNCPSQYAYQYYGGRGIKVCDEWANSFQAFSEWAMSHGYSDNLTIDRIDNDGNYCPENCRWITTYEQRLNKRNSILVDYEGQKMPAAEVAHKLSEESGLPYSVLYERLRRGVSGADLLKPKEPRKQRMTWKDGVAKAMQLETT